MAFSTPARDNTLQRLKRVSRGSRQMAQLAPDFSSITSGAGSEVEKTHTVNCLYWLMLGFSPAAVRCSPQSFSEKKKGGVGVRLACLNGLWGFGVEAQCLKIYHPTSVYVAAS